MWFGIGGENLSDKHFFFICVFVGSELSVFCLLPPRCIVTFEQVSSEYLLWTLVIHFSCINFNSRLIYTCDGCASMSSNFCMWIHLRGIVTATNCFSYAARCWIRKKSKEPGKANLIKCACETCLFQTENTAFYGNGIYIIESIKDWFTSLCYVSLEREFRCVLLQQKKTFSS